MIRERSVQALVAAQVISTLGTQMTWVALPWFVLVTTGSPQRMGLVFAVEVLPLALFGIPSGAVVQRYGARRTMLVADLVSAPLVALVPVLHGAGLLSFHLLLIVVFLLGFVSTPYFSSTRVLLPELLGEGERTISQANSLLEGATQLTGLVGPALAGVLIAGLGAVNVLWLDATSFLASFVLLGLFVAPRRARAAREEQGGVLAGVRFILRDRLLRLVAAVSLLFGIFIPLLIAALPVLAYERYGGRAQVAGWLFAAWGGGSVAGSVLAYRAVARVDPLRLARWACLLCVTPLWLLAFHLPLAGAVSAVFLSSFFVPAVNAPVIGLFTLRTPAPLRGKVMAGLITSNSVARPLSYALAGPLLAAVGLGGTFLVLATGLTAAAALFAGASWVYGGSAATALVEAA